MEDRTTTRPDMAALQKDLDAAIAAKAEADKAESLAQRSATEATNRLTRAQKAFDAGVAAIRDVGARAGGDWHAERSRDRGHTV